MAQVITGLDNIPISAASAAYAPTNTADVTAMIDSAVSAKLDASASSSFQPSGDYVSSSDLSGYLPTSSIGVDSASAVTSIAGSSIATGTQVVTSIYTGGYGVSAINGQVINASHMKIGAEAADNSSNVVKLGDSSYGAGVFLTGNFGTAYYKVNELQLNRNGTGFIGFNIGSAGSQITATSNAGGKFTAGGPNGARSYYTAYNDSASASIEVSADSAKINLADSGYTSTIYPSSIPYWNAKLDSSSIGTSVDGITGIGGTAIADGGTTYTAGQYIQISGDEISVTGLQPSGDYVSSSELADYQPTSSMSAYATTGDLSSKLDESASSSFVTSTADCMPLSASSDYYSTSNPAGYITGVDLTPYQTTAGMSAYATTGDLGDYQPTSSMSAYATTGDLSAKLDASASSSFITSTSDCMPLSASSDYYSTSNPAGYITGVDLTPYQTTADMSAYLPTSSIHSDSAGITSIGGTAVGSKDYTSPSGTIIVSGSTLEGTDSAYVGTLFTGYSGVFGHTSIGPSGNYGAYTFAPIPNTVATRLNLSFGYGASVIYVSSDSLGTIQINKDNDPLSTSEMLSGDTSVTVWTYDDWISCDASYTADSSDTRRIVELAHETALSSYQPTAGMSAYLPTSAIGVDTASSLITGINGSALSAGSTYSAGQYVQISGDEISVTGLQPSGSYVSSTDLSAYQTTADMSGYQLTADMSGYATTGDLSAKLDASASSSFLTAQEQASWSETASASPSYIVDKPDLVDIVAGPGIVVDNPDGNTLRVSSEYDVETVLFNGTASQSITTNETVANFEYIDVYVFTPANSSVENIVRMKVGSTASFVLYAGTISNQFHMFMGVVSASSTTVAISDSGHMWLNKSNAVGSENSTNVKISKVVGVHRIANN